MKYRKQNIHQANKMSGRRVRVISNKVTKEKGISIVPASEPTICDQIKLGE
jgi:hypothetical protein